MIGAITASVPASLAAFGDRIAPGCGGAGTRPLASLRDKAVFDSIIDGFAEPYGAVADRRPLVSLWTQFYLAALVIPSVTALLRFDFELAIALDDVRFELDERCTVSRFLLPVAGRRHGHDDPSPRFECLIEAHLRPFIEVSCTHSGLSRRVLWTNAGAVFDLTVRELLESGPVIPAAQAEAEAVLGWRLAPALRKTPLMHTMRSATQESERQRRVCCLRYRLPGVADCGSLCPLEHHARTPC